MSNKIPSGTATTLTDKAASKLLFLILRNVSQGWMPH